MSGGAEDAVQGELEEERAARGAPRQAGISPAPGQRCPSGPAARGRSSHAPHGARGGLGTGGVLGWLEGSCPGSGGRPHLLGTAGFHAPPRRRPEDPQTGPSLI